MIIIPYYREKHCFPAEVNSPLVCRDPRSPNFFNTCRTKSVTFFQNTKTLCTGTQACVVWVICFSFCISIVMLLQYFDNTPLPMVARGTLGLSAAIWTEIIHLCLCVLQQKLSLAATPLEKTICIWLWIKHVESLAPDGIERQQLVVPRLVWKRGLGQYTLRNMPNNALVVLHKGAHKLWHEVKTPGAYLVLSAVLLSSIRADMQSYPPKPGPQSLHLQAEAAHAVAGSLPLTAVPTNSDSFPLCHGDRRTQEVISSHCHLSDWAGHDL